MQAEIIAVNAQPFARVKGFAFSYFQKDLALLGVQIAPPAVPDSTLFDALGAALARAHIVIVIGDYNPLTDTARRTVCHAVGLELERNEAVCERLKANYQRRGEPVSDGVYAQSEFPAGASIFGGVSGLTTGCAVTSGNQCLVILPGYPVDLGPMLTVDVFDFLARFAGSSFASREVALPTGDYPAVAEALRDNDADGEARISPYLLGGYVYLRALSTAPTVYKAVEQAAALQQSILEWLAPPRTLLLQQGNAVAVVRQIRKGFGSTPDRPSSAAPAGPAVSPTVSRAAAAAAVLTSPVGAPVPEPPDARADKTRGGRGKQQKQTAGPKKSEDDGGEKPKKSKGEVVRRVMIFVCLGVFLASAGYIGWYFLNSHNNKRLAEDMASLYGNDGSIPVGYPEGYLTKFAGLYAVNPDVRGWLEIEGTGVAYPVVQTSDNDYYLRRDFKGNSNDHGVLFLDYRSRIASPAEQSDNVLIYGHNMRDGQMFGELTNYDKLEYYQAHPVLTFDTVYREDQWKILSIFITNTLPEHGDIFWYNSFYEAADQAEFDHYVDSVLRRSLIVTGVDAQYGDKLLTLSTCVYQFSDARMVIVARRVRDGESPEVDVGKAYKNPDPLMPDVWYELYGGSYEGGSASEWQPSYQPTPDGDIPSSSTNSAPGGQSSGGSQGGEVWPPPSSSSSQSSAGGVLEPPSSSASSSESVPPPPPDSSSSAADSASGESGSPPSASDAVPSSSDTEPSLSGLDAAADSGGTESEL